MRIRDGSGPGESGYSSKSVPFGPGMDYTYWTVDVYGDTRINPHGDGGGDELTLTPAPYLPRPVPPRPRMCVCVCVCVCVCYVELYQIEIVFWTFVVCILFKYIMLYYVVLDYLECCWII